MPKGVTNDRSGDAKRGKLGEPSLHRGDSGSTMAESPLKQNFGPETEFCQDHITFWRKLMTQTGGEVSAEQESTPISPRKTLEPTTPPFVYCLYVAWCIPYVFLCRCPTAFFGFWLPFTFAGGYFAYTVFVGSWEWSVSFFVFQCILSLPVWMVVTALCLPASAKFITERLRKKIVVEPGIYYKKDGPMAKLCTWYEKDVMVRYRSGVDPEQTPWIRGPDGQTMFPFIFGDLELGGYFIEGVNYHRVWMQMDDGDMIPCDWSFPKGGYTKGAPILIALHGMNGGSHCAMVKDTVKRANAKGWSVCAPTQRGVHPQAKVKKMLFNGVSSVVDLHTLAGAARECCPGSLIFACGYSMGGVTVSNYAGVYGKESRLDGIVSAAGCTDIRTIMNYDYSHKGYTPFIARTVKVNNLFCPKKVSIMRKHGIDIDLLHTDSVSTMIQWDAQVGTKLTHKQDIVDYYNAISLAPSDPSHADFGKQTKVTTPLLCVQAVNDTIVDINSMDVNVALDNDNIMFIVTKEGGHCGWPLGWNLMRRGYERQSSFVIDFMDALIRSRQAGGGECKK